MLPSGVVGPPWCGAGIFSPSLGRGRRRPLTTIVSEVPFPPDDVDEPDEPPDGPDSGRNTDRCSWFSTVVATPPAYVRGWVLTASIPAWRRRRSSLCHPSRRFARQPRSSLIRGLGSANSSCREM